MDFTSMSSVTWDAAVQLPAVTTTLQARHTELPLTRTGTFHRSSVAVSVLEIGVPIPLAACGRVAIVGQLLFAPWA